MIPVIAQRREELRAICRRFGVRRLDLIGSAARDDFDPARSAVWDIVVGMLPALHDDVIALLADL